MRLRKYVLATVALLAFPIVTLAEGDIEFTPIEHATFVIQSGDVTIFVDPVGDAEAFKAFGKPTIILVTDIHGDHLAPDVIKVIRATNTVVIGPAAATEQLEGATTLANGESKMVGDTKIEAVPMYNLTEERMKFHDKGRGNGYVITMNGKRIYISGDTEDIPEMRALENIDYAFVCMNLPYTMTVEQAASAVLEFKPKVVFPYHYRGKGGMSDTKKFAELVAKDENIEVRQLEWYN